MKFGFITSKGKFKVGTKVCAQYLDQQWRDAKVVMVSEAITGVMYGIVFDHDTQVYQLPRTKIRTEEEIQNAEVADNLSLLDKNQMKSLTNRLSVTVQNFRKSQALGTGEEISCNDWSDWTESGNLTSVSDGENMLGGGEKEEYDDDKKMKN